MNRVLKKSVVIICAVLAAVCLCLCVACQDNTPSDSSVTVTLVNEAGESSPVSATPGDPLPVLEIADKDFEGYWSDAEYAQKYEGEVVPEQNITLYYKLHTQYYTLVIDYGEHGDFSFEVARGEEIALPSVSPAGTEVLGFAEEQGGVAAYRAGDAVSNLAQKDGTATLYACYEVADIEDFIIEDGTLVRYMGRSSSITLPLGATKVAADAFVDNAFSADVVSLTVPGTYTEIECGAFRGLTGLESLTAPFVGGARTRNRFLAYMFGAATPQENTYSFSAYSDGESIYMGELDTDSQVVPLTLRTVRITESVQEIADSAFLNTYGLENLVLDHPEDLRRIGTSAFESCYRFGYDSSLGVPIIPEWLSYVETIGNNAFKSYTGNTESDRKTITTPSGTTATLIENEVPLNNLVAIPALTNAKTIGNYAFYYCAMLQRVSFGSALVSVGDYAFTYSLTISDLRFPDSLQTIGRFAFYVSGIKTVEFGTGIREIGEWSFADCSQLSSVIFKGTSTPLLHGGQPFSNVVTDDSTGEGYDITLNDGFGFYVPSSAADSFRNAADWVQYVSYINPSAENVPAPAYWLTGGQQAAKFEFTGAGVVYVTDPGRLFILSVDTQNPTGYTYAQSCGNVYTLQYEIVSAEDYAAGAGSHTQPLFENQYLLHMWHPDLLGSDGKTPADLYFTVTGLPFASGEGRAVVPVLEQSPAPASYGDAGEEGSFLFIYNEYGILQVQQVTGGKATALEAPEGTYYARLTADDAQGIGYTLTYYNDNFDVIAERGFWRDADKGDEAPFYARTEDSPVFLSDGEYNDGTSLFLHGDGTAQLSFFEGGELKEYTASAAADPSKTFGEEGYTVTLSGLKGADGSSVSGSGKAVFSGFTDGNYARVDLTVGSSVYMIMNVRADMQWDVSGYNNLASEVKVKMPAYSSNPLVDSWRYAKLSSADSAGSVIVYSVADKAYFREYDAQGRVVAFGTAQVGENSVTLVGETKVTYGEDGTPAYAEDTASRTAEVCDGRGSLSLDGKTYTYYNSREDLTLVYYETSLMGGKTYYYTVKTDGYGNMYVLDESSAYTQAYLGTYVPEGNITVNGIEYTVLHFTGNMVDNYGRPESSETVERWILYIDVLLQERSDDDSEAHWWSDLAGIYTAKSEDTVYTVFDDFGYKLYEITVDSYGSIGYVRYEYTLKIDGTAEYTPVAEDGIVFTPVLDENENVAYFVAVGEDGVALFSVRPNGAENGFSVVQDGGLLVGSDIPARFTVDTEAMEQLPAGISFGDIA